RFACSTVELDGVLYVVGGFDGKNYLKSAERFDPREASWSKLHSMNTSRGSHALTVFKGKLYALGGYDGSQYVPTVEVFDPLMGTWIEGDKMKQSRGYFVAPVIGEAIYAIGGQKEGNDIVDSVEIYRQGHGWSTTILNGIGKKCFFSAVLH
ncbi:Kelch-like protein diablo, partial [Thalictrum thalictroides]